MPDFFYFRELLLGDDNKFTLDFSNKEFVQEIEFSSKNDYYITSLNCNLIVKEHIDDRKKLIQELSQKSRLLLEKGPAYENDIDQIEYCISSVGLIPWKDYFKIFLPTETLNLTCWKYEYYDVIEKKKIKPCKIYATCTHFLTIGFTFSYNTTNNNDDYYIRFNEINHLIILPFIISISIHL